MVGQFLVWGGGAYRNLQKSQNRKIVVSAMTVLLHPSLYANVPNDHKLNLKLLSVTTFFVSCVFN